jgi:hypothetical protein
MTDDTTRQIAVLDHQIATLQAQKAALTTQPQPPWPRHLRVAVQWLSRADKIASGTLLGLQEVGLDRFSYFGESIPLEVTVAEDGWVTILTCAGRQLLPKE